MLVEGKFAAFLKEFRVDEYHVMLILNPVQEIRDLFTKG